MFVVLTLSRNHSTTARLRRALLVPALACLALLAPTTVASASPSTSDGGVRIQVSCDRIWTGRTGTDYLPDGTCITPGTFLQTGWYWRNGRQQQLTLAYQEDGNLVEYRWIAGQGYGTAIWSSGTPGQPQGTAALQRDGNFVLYKPGGSWSYWSTNTWNCAGSWPLKTLQLQEDENVVLYFWPPNGNTGNRVAKWDAWGNARGC
jgi:hypothetical protein